MKTSTSLRSLLSVTAVMTLLLALICGALPAATAQGPLTPESNGKQIYMQGTSASSKDILAYLGEASLEVPGSAMACAGCHGLNGQGKPEGGVNPLNLTWEALSKPFVRPDGRRRSAYDDLRLELAITRGSDPDGKKLLNAMPRYQMSKADLAALIAYLRLVGKDRDPRISENRIVIGGVVPVKGELAEMGQAVKAVTTAYFEEVNSQGGIYNRRLELKFAETGETPAETRANVERLIKDEQVFAMTGAFMAGAEKQIIQLMAEQRVPLIGPFTLFPQTSLPINREVFYLLSGIGEQARALMTFVAGKSEFKNLTLTVVYPVNETNERILHAIQDQSKKASLKAPEIYSYKPGDFHAAEVITQLKQPDRESIVLFLGRNEELLSFMREAEKVNWFPTTLVPGTSAGAGVFSAPAGFDGKVFFTFPTSPVDQTVYGIQEFRALMEKYKLPPKHVAAQLSAYGAAKIMIEALKRAGKDLSRERLITALEGFHEFQTGLTPDVTYGRNRRIGARGSYIVTIDLKQKQFVPASGWVDIGN